VDLAAVAVSELLVRGRAVPPESTGSLFTGGYLVANGFACTLSSFAYLALTKKFPKP